MEALVVSMKSDRLIKLIIGDLSLYAIVVYVSKVTLEQTSEYFCAALRNQHLGNNERDTLKFPEDDPTA
ncbi:hypothetical protein LTR27_006504 [Elasticomyces elasticus]|nr:hypothetical protein LTR27_006504 [Elasticomyces elasticus]